MSRFMTRDPQGLSSTNGFLAMYSYANNNPLAGMDPTGRYVFGGGIGGIAGGGWPAGMSTTGDAVLAGFGTDGTGVSSSGAAAGGGAGGQGGSTSNSTTPGTEISAGAPTDQASVFVTVPCGRPVVGLEDAIAGVAGVAAGAAAEAAAPEVPYIGVAVGVVTGIAVGQAFYGVGCTAQVAGPVPSAVAAAVATPAAFGGVAFISAGPAIAAPSIGGVPFP